MRQTPFLSHVSDGLTNSSCHRDRMTERRGCWLGSSSRKSKHRAWERAALSLGWRLGNMRETGRKTQWSAFRQDLLCKYLSSAKTIVIPPNLPCTETKHIDPRAWRTLELKYSSLTVGNRRSRRILRLYRYLAELPDSLTMACHARDLDNLCQ